MTDPFLTLVHIYNQKTVNFFRENDRIRIDTRDNISKMATCTYFCASAENDVMNEIKRYIDLGYRHPEVVRALCYESLYRTSSPYV